MIHGIDVSQHQGVIDWPQVANAGVQFCIIRHGDGAYRDTRFQENIAGAKAVGIPVSVYHFLRWDYSPEHQAAECRRAAEMAEARVWLDCEDDLTFPSWHPRVGETTAFGLMSLTQRSEWLHELVARLGLLVAGIYTAAWWWRPNMGNSHGFNALPLWVANYPWDTMPMTFGADPGWWPILCGDWHEALVWQWSSSGAVPGINERVDLNVAQDSFLEGGSEMAFTEAEERELKEFIKNYMAWRAANPNELSRPDLMRVWNTSEHGEYVYLKLYGKQEGEGS